MSSRPLALLLAFKVSSLTRVDGLVWWRFARAAKWTLLAYVTIAGMIEFAFLENHISGETLVVLTLSLGGVRARGPDPDRLHGCAPRAVDS